MLPDTFVAGAAQPDRYAYKEIKHEALPALNFISFVAKHGIG